MQLAVDIGNSNAHFGIFDDNDLLQKFQIATPRGRDVNFISEEIARFIPKEFTLDAVIISSVVPELSMLFSDAIQKNFLVVPRFISAETNFAQQIDYDHAAVGVDRIVAAIAAVHYFGAPCIVCDFGTAATIDAVDERGVFIGGTISPGMDLMARSLSTYTSRLPRTTVEVRKTVIGKNTFECIQSGIFFGGIGFYERIIKQMRIELGPDTKTVATGGGAELLQDYVHFNYYEPNLMLYGLNHILLTQYPNG